MATLIPSIGASGLYELSSPFDTLLKTNTSYTCIGVRLLSDYTAKGEDPFTDFYQPKSLSNDVYESDFRNGVCIITLQSSGDIQYVPSSYIKSFPNSGGVPYNIAGIGINLGALPEGLDLTLLLSQIKDLISANLGVTPNSIKRIKFSDTTMVTNEDHTASEASRQLKITNNTTDYALYKAAVARAEKAEAQNKVLTQYIINNNTAKTSNSGTTGS